MVADVELLVDLFGQTVGIGQAVLAGGTLTGDNRTNQRTGTASGQAMLSQEIDQRLNILMLDALDFQSQTGSHGNSTGTKLLCSLCHSTMLIGSDLTIAGNDTNIEYVGVTLILQAAQTLDALDLLGRQNTAFELNLYLVCEQTAFQSQGVGVAVCLQTVLQEVATLTLSADQQQLGIQIQAVNGAGDLCQIDPLSTGDGGSGADIDDLVALCLGSGILGGSHGLVLAGHLVLQNVASLDERMDRSRERRCVSKVQRIEILNLSTHGNAGDSNVNHLVHCTCTQNLNAQQLMGCLVSNQLGHKGGSVGIVMCLIVSNTGNGDHIVACFFSLCLGQTGTACVQTFSQLHNAGAQAAAVGNRFAGQVLGQQTAGDIGGRAHGGPLTLTGQTVEYLSAVANSVNIVQIGALELIHHNGATVQLNAGVGKPCGSGTDANCQNNSFAVEVANGGADTGCLVAAQNLGEACAGDNTDALCLQLLTDVVGHLSVEQVGHNLRSHVNYSNLQTLGQQVLCNLQTNEAAADNNCVAALVLVHISAQADGVIRSTHGEYAGKVRTGHIGNKGGSAGSDDQLVVGNDFAVCESNGLGSSVNAHSFHLGLDLNAGEAGVLCRGVDDQLVTAFDAAANIVGQAAASIGNILALGVNGDFRAAILTHQLGSGLGTGGNTADYNNVHISNSFFIFPVFCNRSVLSQCSLQTGSRRHRKQWQRTAR